MNKIVALAVFLLPAVAPQAEEGVVSLTVGVTPSCPYGLAA